MALAMSVMLKDKRTFKRLAESNEAKKFLEPID
jgi:hypothetical protein